MTSKLRRGGKSGQPLIRGEQEHVMPEAEAEEKQLEDKESQGFPQSPEALRESMALPTP